MKDEVPELTVVDLVIWRPSPQQASGRCLDAVVRVRLRFYEAAEKQDSQWKVGKIHIAAE